MYLANPLFLNNSFTDEYYSIINNAASQARIKQDGVYYEIHHIIPKSMGGTNDKSNLVALTAKEHYRVHQLLVNMTTGKNRSKMINAFWFFANKDGCKISADEYQMIREEFQKKVSEQQSGTNNSFYGKTHSDDHRERSRQQMIAYNKENPNKSEEAKINMSMAKKGKYNGSDNPNFGKKWPNRIWMHHPVLKVGTMINRSAQAEFEEKGYILGRLK
jgi:hypothetical protein